MLYSSFVMNVEHPEKISWSRHCAPTLYNAVFLLHAPAPIKIGFGAVRCGLMWRGVGAVLRFRLDSFGLDWVSSNVNLNLKNPLLQQLKNLSNYSIKI
jgi:hypothetical protein